MKNVKHYQLIILVSVLLIFVEFFGFLHLDWWSRQADWWKHQNYRLLSDVLRPIASLRQMWQLNKQLEDLQYRYNEAAAQLGRLRTLEEENQHLRSMIDNEALDYEASVISAPITSFAQSFVAAGSEQGVQQGAAVVSQGNLLGVVEDVHRFQSRVLLLQHMLDVGVVVQTSNGVKGLVKGNGRDILLTEVASTAGLQVGDLVYSLGQQGMSSGLVLGKIAVIMEQNPSLSTKTARLESLVNFYEVSLVEIR